MKPTAIFSLLASLLFLFSCQKQLSWSIDPITSDIVGDSLSAQAPALGLLEKVVATTGNDLLETRYTYNAAGNLIAEEKSGLDNGSAIQQLTILDRDSSGKVLRIASVSKGTADTAVMTIVYDDYYTKIIQYVLSYYTQQQQQLQDSIVFTYDGNSHIAVQKVHRKMANGYSLAGKKEYVYSGGNLVNVKEYVDSSNTGILVPVANYNFNYDKRQNPLQLGVEALLLNQPAHVSANNAIGLAVDDRRTPANSFQNSSKLLYGGSGKPLSCTCSRMPAGAITYLQYFYQ